MRGPKGQLSAEMLILIVVVLAVLAILATQMLGTAKEGSAKVSEGSQDIFDKASGQIKAKSGSSCVVDDDCESGACLDTYRCA